jgi:hypothetical protein
MDSTIQQHIESDNTYYVKPALHKKSKEAE